MKRFALLFAILGAFAATASGSSARAEIVRLTVDARPTPVVGTDSRRPEFGWEISAPELFDVRQTACSIDVATSREKLDSGEADVWRSGAIATERPNGIVCGVDISESTKRYFWRATVSWRGVDANGSTVEKTESADAEFVSAVLDPSEWAASWITADRTDADPLPLLYKDFRLDQPKANVEDAFLCVCGLGQQIASVNARRVGDRTGVDPGWTNYRKTCLYATFDVKDELTSAIPGANANACSLSVFLGNGMYNVPGGRYVKFTGSFGLPKAIVRLVVRFNDGSVQTVVSDSSWKTLPTPLVFSCVYGGDDVDFSRGESTQNGLTAVGVAKPALETEGPGGVLRAQIQPPVVVLETLKPIEVKTLDDGKIEANFDFNFAGQPVVRVAGVDGKKIDVTLAEMVGKPWNGRLDSYSFGNADSLKKDSQTVCVDAAQTGAVDPNGLKRLGSTFGYWGFQYVYVDGAEYCPDASKAAENAEKSGKPQVVEIAADRIGANLERVGSFESDGEHLNEIDLMIDRSVRSNIVSLMTDCPHREKLGWLEETHLMGPSILYRYNLQALFRKVCRDMTEAQLDDGMIPDIAPEYTRFVQGFFWSAEWSAAAVQVPWLLYRWYGDERIIAEQYETMDKYVRFEASTRDDKGLVKAGLGDWYDWSPEKSHPGYSQHTPGELTATAFLCDNARIMEIFAEKLGKADDAKFYRELRAQAVADFQKAYFNPETAVVATGSQASYAFALYFDLIPQESRDKAFAHLLEDIEKWGYRPSVGEVAWPFLIRTLASFGRTDVLWKTLQREDAPGYVHMLVKWGMKTLSETWDGPGSSMNHFMFGAIQEWFSSDVVGISQTENSVAFSEIVLRPSPMVGKINRAKGDYRSIYGVIVSDWAVDEATGEFGWNVEIPVGSTARVEIPVANETSAFTTARVDGDATIPFDVEETRFEPAVGENPARRIATLGSGRYRIESQLTEPEAK